MYIVLLLSRKIDQVRQPQLRFARRRWLLGLLVLQSSSSFVLDRYEGLLKEHIFVTLFLTMLVGAGGNAGNRICNRKVICNKIFHIKLDKNKFPVVTK
jgi:uncharacterized membrane protein